MEERYQLLIVKHLSGESTTEQERELEAWLKQDPLHGQEFTSLRELWQLANHYTPQVDAGTEVQWQGFKDHIAKGAKTASERTINRSGSKNKSFLHIFKQMPLRIAASVALVLLCTLLYWQGEQLFILAQSTEMHTSKGEQKRLMLPDGTIVWLNGESKLYYPSTFSGNTREVTLEGEAFFEVAKDSLKPFVIEAQQSLTQVLGTSFNVRAYEEEETVEVAVLTGNVALKSQDEQSRQTLLLPGFSGIYHKSANWVKRVKNEDENFLSWKTGSLTFKRTRLVKVAADLSRHYKKEISIEGGDISTLQITTSFSRQPLRQVLEEITLLLNISYHIEGERVILKAKAN